MEGSSGIGRNRSWHVFDPDEVGGIGADRPPYDRRGSSVKYSQAAVVQVADGQWKLVIQSDRQIEAALIGSLDDVLKELKFATTHREWERRKNI